MSSLTISPRRYLQQINGQSFEECMQFIAAQSQALGVQVSAGMDIGQVLYAWANYLTQESEGSERIFKNAADIVHVGGKPHDAYKRLQSLNDALNGRRNWVDSVKNMLGQDSMGELAATIQAHPFYEVIQKEALSGGFEYVTQAYNAFKTVDDRLRKTKAGLAEVESKLRSLKEYDFGLNNIFIPPDVTDNLAVASALAETRQLLELEPELFYSPTAAALLADASVKELFMLRQQSLVALDLAMSRWCLIAYFGLLLNASIKHVASAQTFAAVIAASNDQLKQFGALLTAVSSAK